MIEDQIKAESNGFNLFSLFRRETRNVSVSSFLIFLVGWANSGVTAVKALVIG
jgi:hypothetical protein